MGTGTSTSTSPITRPAPPWTSIHRRSGRSIGWSARSAATTSRSFPSSARTTAWWSGPSTTSCRGSSARRKSQVPTHTPLPKLVGRIDDRPQWQRNTLLWNRGDGTFAQIGGYAGIEASDWTWDVLFLDVDLDGYEDVLATTGHLWDVMDADTWERVRATFTPSDWRRELALFPRLAVRNIAFRNNSDLTFSDAGPQWGL